MNSGQITRWGLGALMVGLFILVGLKVPGVARSAVVNAASLETLRALAGNRPARELQGDGRPGWEAGWLDGEPRLEMLQARLLLSQGRPEGAQSLLESLTGRLPVRREVLRWAFLAQAYEEVGQLERAREVYIQIGSPDYLEARARYAGDERANYEEAIRYISWAISLQPGKAVYYALAAEWYGDLGDPGSALDYWRNAVLLDPDRVAYRILLADTLAQLGSEAEAEFLLKGLAQEQVGVLVGIDYFYIGMIYRNLLGMDEPALAALEEAVRLDPNPSFKLELGRTLQQLGRYAEALAWYEKVAFDPDEPPRRRAEAFERIGDLARIQGEIGKAVEAYESALDQLVRCGENYMPGCAKASARVKHSLDQVNSPSP